jgi:hypothetical protein
LVFSKDAPDVLWEMTRCVWSIGALPELMVWDREGCLHLAVGARPWIMRVGWVEESPVLVVEFEGGEQSRQPGTSAAVPAIVIAEQGERREPTVGGDVKPPARSTTFCRSRPATL